MLRDQKSMDALLFELNGARFALPVGQVREVVCAVAIEPLPQAPRLIAGVINYRGSVIPVLNLRARLELPDKAVAPEHHFIIAELGGRCVALHIDAPLELQTVTPVPLSELGSQLVEPQRWSGCIAGAVPTRDGVLLIQDLPQFLSPQEAAALERALRGAVCETEPGA